MTVNKNVLRFVIFNFVIETQGLEIKSANENIKNIKETEDAIRNTTNEIFLALRLKGVKKNPKLKQHSLIHNYFTSISLKDDETFNTIAAISRIDKCFINNTVDTFLNALLNEDPHDNTEEIDNNDFLEHVTNFLTKLEYLKDSNGLKNSAISNINDKMMEISEYEISNKLNVTSDDSDENDSDDDFWVPERSGRRIFKGDRTKIKHFPFMVSVQIFDKFQCSGSIIQSDVVITAASCLQLAWNNRFFRENPAFLSVRVGSTIYKAGGERIAVLEVYFHPEYNPKTLKNNICLLRLVRRIKFRKKQKKVKKIAFDRNPSNLPLTTDGITIIGWGAKGSGNVVRDPWKNQLSFSVLDIYPNKECQDIYSREYVTHKNFCAGFFSKGGGACNGDVGGPGVVSGVLAGVVSFGSPVCGAPDAPTVFTKLGYYADWIESILEQDVPVAHARTTSRPPPIPITFEPLRVVEKTTFVIEPFVGKKIKPIPINQPYQDEEPLRVLDNQSLFKEFLATMFGSKEAKDYEDLFAIGKTEDENKIDKFVEKTRHEIKQKPKIERQKMEQPPNVAPQQTSTQTYDKYTVLDKNLLFESIEREGVMSDSGVTKSDEELEKNILKVIENIDVNSDKEVRDESISYETQELVLDDELNTLREDKRKNIDESILTLLYLSDSENTDIGAIGKALDELDSNVNKDLSIVLEGFKDLPVRNNGTGSFSDFLPKDEMYELLAEAIDDVAKNKHTK